MAVGFTGVFQIGEPSGTVPPVPQVRMKNGRKSTSIQHGRRRLNF